MALIDIGHIHFDADPDQAIEDLAKVLPEYDFVLSHQAHLMRADLYERKKDFAHAVGEYNALITEPERNPDLVKKRAIAYRAVGDFSNAVADFSKLIDMNPGSAITWDDRGDTFYASGDYERAVADYLKDRCRPLCRLRLF